MRWRCGWGISVVARSPLAGRQRLSADSCLARPRPFRRLRTDRGTRR